MHKLSFSAAEHEYRLDGRRVPSVTGIIRLAGLTSGYSFEDPIHSFRGLACHHGAALIDAGEEDVWFGVDLPGDHPRYREYLQVAHDINYGYLPAYREFREHTGFHGHTYELGMIHPLLRFGGTLDSCGECGEEIWLMDFKSGVLPELVPIQLAGYDMLIRQGQAIDPEHPGLDWLQEVIRQERKIHRKALRLQKNGTWTLFSETSKKESYDSRTFDKGWLAAINLYNLRSAYGFI